MAAINPGSITSTTRQGTAFRAYVDPAPLNSNISVVPNSDEEEDISEDVDTPEVHAPRMSTHPTFVRHLMDDFRVGSKTAYATLEADIDSDEVLASATENDLRDIGWSVGQIIRFRQWKGASESQMAQETLGCIQPAQVQSIEYSQSPKVSPFMRLRVPNGHLLNLWMNSIWSVML